MLVSPQGVPIYFLPQDAVETSVVFCSVRCNSSTLCHVPLVDAALVTHLWIALFYGARAHRVFVLVLYHSSCTEGDDAFSSLKWCMKLNCLPSVFFAFALCIAYTRALE